MIYPGILAAPALLTPAPASGTDVNFLTGSYTVSGVTRAAADIVETPAAIGASGLHAGNTGPIGIIGPLLSALLAADWTMVVEYEELHASTGRTFLVTLESADESEELNFLRDNNIELKANESSPATGTAIRELYDPDSGAGPWGLGVHIVALTRTETRFAMAGDGRTRISVADYGTSTVTAFNLTQAAFGGYPDGYYENDVYIRRLTLQSPVDDSALSALTA